MFDKDEIIRALQLWFLPGDVFEVRVLDAVTADYRREHVESGYFDFEHIALVPEALKRLLSYRGVYVTVNPVNPDLLARAVNRIRAVGKSPTTADSDIPARRWLLVDCDAVRPTGVSSSEAEHHAALAKAREIRDGLSSLGWPNPVMTDSGNGAQLMYRIDLPGDDDGLLQKCLKEIAKASSPEVAIDLTVHNPARIWRVPGTMNCKGDSIPNRPHRMAQILSASQNIGTVTTAQMQKIANSPVEESVPDTFGDRDENIHPDFNIDAWIQKYCPELGAPQEWKGGRRWVFPVCPFNSNHVNRSAVLIQQPSGAVAFTCHHNGCKGNDWRGLRELKEPGCYDRPAEDVGVDFSGILNQNGSRPEKVESLFPNPGPLPEHLLAVPGFIEDVVQLSMNTAPYPNRVLAFTGALAALAFLVGRKVQDKRDNRSNLYLVALADSGTGKDHPRKVNINLAFRANISGGVGDAFASGEGLEDALFLHPSMLFQVDEFDCIFNNMKYSKDNRSEGINEKLLKLYGSANSLYSIRKKAMVKLRSSDQKVEVEHIVNPNLVIFGTAIPKYFYESLSRRVLENGLVARCIIVESGGRGKGCMARSITPSDALLRAVNYLVNIKPGGDLSHEYPKPLIISETAGATERIQELQAFCDEQYDFYLKRGEGSAMALWARAHEKICKLAMLHGISTNVYEPLITVESVEWAFRFVDHLTRRMLYMADAYVYENVFDEKCQKVVRLLEAAGGKMKHWMLLKKSHESLDVFKKVTDTLMENGTISFEMETGKTKPSKVYILL